MTSEEAPKSPARLSRKSRGISFDEKEDVVIDDAVDQPPPRTSDSSLIVRSSMSSQQKSSTASQRTSDASAAFRRKQISEGGSSHHSRPSLRRNHTGDPGLRNMRRPPALSRSLSGDSGHGARRDMMQRRAMSTRDVRGGGAGRGGGMAAKSMSTRLLGEDNVFSRMASTRALFMDEGPVQEPSIIVYMGREIKTENYIDDDWLDDALDEEAGVLKGTNNSSRLSHGNTRQIRHNSSRRHHDNDTDNEESFQNGSFQHGSFRNDSDNESASEVSETMEEMDESSGKNVTSSEQKRGSRNMRQSRQPRSKSSDPAPRPSRAPPKRGCLGRSRTFDGTQTSEIFPRRRKPKRASSTPGEQRKENLNKKFQEFLSKTGGGTPIGNHRYQNQNGNQSNVVSIRRRKPKMPKSRKKVEQFRKLEYTAEDIQDVLCENDETFQRLKRVLTKKGAITNGVLQQRLHIFLKKAKDRQSKLIKQRKEEGDAQVGEDEADDMTNIQPNQPDWAAMSMMDMFAQSVRKLTTDTESPSAASTPTGPSGEEPWKRRNLPRAQAVMANKERMQTKTSTRALMTTFTESEEEEETSNHDNSQKIGSVRVSNTSKDTSSCRTKPSSRSTSLDPNSALPPTIRPEPAAIPAIYKRDSTDDNRLSADPTKVLKPIELPVARGPTKLDPTQHFEEALPVEPKCLDDDLSSSQRPMELDLSQNFQHVPTQPKCLDDELSASQRPMKLDLNQNFGGDLPLQPKCLDDSKTDAKPMTLDLSAAASGRRQNDSLLFKPKHLDEEREDADLLFEPKNLDESNTMDDSKKTDSSSKMDDSSKTNGARARRRHRPSRIRNYSTNSKSSGSSKSATPTRDRVRRAKSYGEPPALKLEVRCLDDPQTPPSLTGSNRSRNSNASRTRSKPRSSSGSTAKPAAPELLVGWQH